MRSDGQTWEGRESLWENGGGVFHDELLDRNAAEIKHSRQGNMSILFGFIILMCRRRDGVTSILCLRACIHLSPLSLCQSLSLSLLSLSLFLYISVYLHPCLSFSLSLIASLYVRQACKPNL